MTLVSCNNIIVLRPFFAFRRGAGRRARLHRLAAIALLLPATTASADPIQDAARRLMAAYPGHITGVESNTVIWSDGTRMPIDDGRGAKSPDALLADADLEDMFAIPYVTGAPAPPARGHDPGRARAQAFFDKMYGDCRTGAVRAQLVNIDWLPGKGGGKLQVTRINGVDEKLRAVSAELDRLPHSMDTYLMPAAGTYNCRVIAGTERVSTHGHGIAIDLALKHADYWRWHKPDASGGYSYRNRIPIEIVEIFEKHGFIWGGRWSHYDTMHFEYRPELFLK